MSAIIGLFLTIYLIIFKRSLKDWILFGVICGVICVINWIWGNINPLVCFAIGGIIGLLEAIWETHYRNSKMTSPIVPVEPTFSQEHDSLENTQEKIIMPETKRIFGQNWEEAPLLGIFNVTQTITYLDEDGKAVTDTFKRISIICPLWLIILVIAILILFIISVIFNRKRRKAGHNKKPSWEQDQ